MPKTLEELKKENEEKNKELDLEKKPVEKEGDDPKKEQELDKDGNVIVPLWADPEDLTKKKDEVPVKTHVEMKKKLRGRLSEKDEKIEKLEKENLLLKKGVPKEIKLPNPADFAEGENDELYKQAVNEYKDADATDRYIRIHKSETQKTKQEKAKKDLNSAVDDHYDRASVLVKDNGINPELFQKADLKVRGAIEALMPGAGDVVTDNFIATLGKGSEKVLYYLGVNETALNKFQSLLIADPSGMKAAIFLGQEKQRITKPIKKRSNAPNPPTQHQGDAGLVGNAKILKRQYDKAHKTGDIQLAFNIKQQAKKEEIDVKGWIGE